MDDFLKTNGVVIPMITPFTRAGKININDSKKVAAHLFEEKVSVLLLGTTGEALSIPDQERIRFVKAVIEEKPGDVNVFAGISQLCFNNSVKLAHHFFNLGVDAVAAHLPPYYPLTDDQIKIYYSQLADKIPGPLFIYNIPQTVHMSISLDIVEELSYHPNICGVKDSEHDFERLKSSVSLWSQRSDFIYLTGWGSKSASGLLLGADGIVPATGNLIPALFRELYEAAIDGDEENASILQKESDELSNMYREDKNLSQSIAVLKVIMEYYDLCSPHVLSPLTEYSEQEKQASLQKVLSHPGLGKLKQKH